MQHIVALSDEQPDPTAVPVPLGADSLFWRIGLPRTAILFAGRTLLMQTSHPMVGAGVADFSTYRTDPWGRLDRTVESLLVQIFGGERSAVESQRLHDLHRGIKGLDAHGRRYSALDPNAFAWVHLSTFDGLRVMHRLTGWGPRDDAGMEQLYLEWRRIGLVLGVKDRLMPPDVAGLTEYVSHVVEQTLQPNQTTEELLRTLTLNDVPAPPYLPRPAWTAAKPLGRFALRSLSIGTLDPSLRRRLGIAWVPSQQRGLERSARALRAVTPLIPQRVLQYPQSYEAQRLAQHCRRTHGG